MNYGHTIGHAVEAASNYQQYVHGEAVSIGMYGAALAAEKLGLIGKEIVETHARILGRAGLPVSYSGLTPSNVLAHLELDKKRLGGNHRMVLLRGIGKPTIVNVDEKVVREVLEILKEG